MTYRARFLDTPKNLERRSEPVKVAEGKALAVTRRYRNDIGTVLADQCQSLAGTDAERDLAVTLIARLRDLRPEPEPAR